MTWNLKPAAVAFSAAFLTFQAGVVDAATNGTALVVGDAQYAGQTVLAACNRAAHSVSDHLRGQGFSVSETIDGSALALRDALGDFAAHANASSGPALIYVCAEATAIDQRLFVLPSDVDLGQPLRPETQGVVLRALLNAMAGTRGTMIAELALRPGADARPVMAALQDGVPEGLHLALSISDGKETGTLGERLSANGAAIEQNWDQLAASLQAAPQATPTTIALFRPPPTQVQAAAVANVPTQLDAPPSASSAAPPPAPSSAPTVVALSPSAAAAAEPRVAAAPDPARGSAQVAALVPPVTTGPAPPAKRMPLTQAGNERTRRLQTALTRRRFYSGPLDGVTGAQTYRAILSYQVSIGDRPTGALTGTEIVRLLNSW